ncbi:tryptophan biosynthesis modulator TrpM [Streptomyces sp. CA-132043]|uniref:tryptophan biosynthesis modulator TrpM n=1 Tax=Streptomyces sp. CA-132043 TaxID=3240048 RepID=UPI003D931083
MTAAVRRHAPRPGHRPAAAGVARLPHAALGRGCPPVSRHRPEPKRCALPPWHRGCRAPARRVHGRRVRYHIGAEPGQINGSRWPRPAPRAGSHA